MTDVYIRFKTAYLSSTFNLSRNLSKEVAWLRERAIDYGKLDGWILGAYVKEDDAIIYKLTFGEI